MNFSEKISKIAEIFLTFLLIIGVSVIIKTMPIYCANGLIDGLRKNFDGNSKITATLDGKVYTLSEALNKADVGKTVYIENGVIDSDLTVPKGVTLSADCCGLVINSDVNLVVDGKMLIGNKDDLTSATPDAVVCNGNITVNGVLEVYALVVGEGCITVNGTFYEPLFIPDYFSEVADDIYKRGNLPFNQYYLNTVKIKRTINANGRFLGVLPSETFINFIASDGLFALTDGRAEISYDKNQNLDAKVCGIDNLCKTDLSFYGNVSVKSADFVFDKTYSSFNRFLSVPYFWDINVKEGNFNVTENAKLKIMTGATFKVFDGASLNVDGTFGVYDGFYSGEYSGVSYLDSQTLQKMGLSGSGSLIVNGTLNINGRFYGTVQTESQNGLINVSETALLTDTVTEGFSVKKFGNLCEFTASAKAYALNGFIALERGKTYKSGAISPFLLKTVSIDKVIYGDLPTEYKNHIIEINQTCTGRFLCFTDGGYVSDVTFYIGEAVKNVCVNLNGKDYYTNKDGKFTAEIYLSDGVTYHTAGKDNFSRKAEVVYDSDVLLDSVVKSIVLDDDYVIKEGFARKFFAIVSFYGGRTERIEVTPDYNKTSDYVAVADFTSDGYILDSLTHKVYFYLNSFDDYKNNYNGLIGGHLSKESVTSVYNEYLNLTENRNAEDLSFIKTVLDGYCDFSYVIDFCAQNVTYGDTSTKVVTLSVDGTKIIQTATLYDYNYSLGDITVRAEYTGNFNGVSYTLEKVLTNVNPKKVTYIIDSKSGVYLDAIKPLTGRFTEELSDQPSVTLYTTATDNSVAGNYSVTGKCDSPFYDVIFANANYEIAKRKITVKIKDKTVYLNECNIIPFDYVSDYNAIKYFKVSNDKNSAIIDLSGNLSEILTEGVYTVTPVFDNDNFIAEGNTATLTVLKGGRYTVNFGFTSGDEKVYDGKSLDFTVSAIDNLNTAVTPSVNITVTLDGCVVSKILNKGSYLVTAEINESKFYANFTVKPCPVNITAVEDYIYYGDRAESLNFVSDIPLEVCNAKFTVNEFVSAECLNTNYFINSFKQIKVLPRRITVKIDDKIKFYGDFDEAISCSIIKGYVCEFDSIGKILTFFREQGEGVGSYKISAECVNDNYDVIVIDAKYDILPRPITVTANPVSAKYGEDFELTVRVIKGSLAYFDELSKIVDLYREKGDTVGVYKIFATPTNPNYRIDFIGANAEILPLNITVSLPNVSAVYGENINITAASTDLPYGICLENVIKITCDNQNAVGSYKIYAQKINDNFTVNFDYEYGDHSLLTITKREVTLELDDVYAEFTDTFNEIAKKVSFTVTSGSLLDGDELSLEFFAKKDDLKIDTEFFGAPDMIGNYRLYIFDCNPNYCVTAKSCNLFVTKKQVWLKDVKTDFVYNGNQIEFFDVNKNIGGLGGLSPQGFYITVTGDNDNKVVNAGSYTVKVYLDDRYFEFTNSNAFILTVDKADIGQYIDVDSDYGKFIVIGKNRPIARLLGYNAKLKEEYYYGETLVSNPDKEGEFSVKITVIDDNYKGEAVKTFTACVDVKGKVDKISALLEELKKEESLKMTNLLKIKEVVAFFTEGDNAQINKISAYKSVIEQYIKAYEDFYNDKTQNYETANGALGTKNLGDLSLLLLTFFTAIALKPKGGKS